MRPHSFLKDFFNLNTVLYMLLLVKKMGVLCQFFTMPPQPPGDFQCPIYIDLGFCRGKPLTDGNPMVLALKKKSGSFDCESVKKYLNSPSVKRVCCAADFKMKANKTKTIGFNRYGANCKEVNDS